MTISFTYPIAETKNVVKEFHCSSCKRKMKVGMKYIRMNHGRYCASCSKDFDTRYAKV
jgi:hypothetical protein